MTQRVRWNDLTKYAQRVLKRVPAGDEQFGFQIAHDGGFRTKRAAETLEGLEQLGLIERARAGSSAALSAWTMTDKGKLITSEARL